MENSNSKRKSTTIPLIKFLIFLIYISAVSILILYLRDKPLMDPQWIVGKLEDYGKESPVFFIILYTLRPLILFPASILSIAGGLIYGAIDSTVYSVIGGTLGAVVAFCISRIFGKDFVDRFLWRYAETMNASIGETGFKIIFLLRVIPFIPFDLVNYGAGLTKINTRDYILGTLLGLIPSSFVYAFLGSSLNDVTSWKFFQAFLIFILIILIAEKYKKKIGEINPLK